ncbi:MAG: hypothetical protein COA83_09865 [Methylophaga sp.]|nr:MAG: hypothetical protein COA83_09865 [Methylophaga sp.]
MANENIGEIKWGCCAAVIKFVRMDKKEKLYISCPSCGNSAAKGKTFQETIKGRAVMYGTPSSEYAGGGEPEKVSKNPEAVGNEPEAKAENFTPEPTPPQKKEPRKVSRLLSGLMNALGNEE